MASPVPKRKDLAEDLHDVKTKWRAIGIQLEVEEARLKQIDYSYKTDPEGAFMEMMDSWRCQVDPEPSWGALVDALRSRSVGETALASEIEAKWCPGRPAPAIARAPPPTTVTHNATLYHLQALPYKTRSGEKLKIIERTAPRYATIGIFLLNDRDGSKIKRIEMANHYKPDAIMKDIFQEWIATEGNHSWKRLVGCLKDCSLNTLAQDILQALKQNGVSD